MASDQRLTGSEIEIDGNDLFTHAPVGMVVMSPQGDILKVNVAFTELVGYRAEELTSKPYKDLVLPTDRDAFNREMEALLAGTVTKLQVRKCYIHKNNREIHVLFIASLYSRNGHRYVQGQAITTLPNLEGTGHASVYFRALMESFPDLL